MKIKRISFVATSLLIALVFTMFGNAGTSLAASKPIKRGTINVSAVRQKCKIAGGEVYGCSYKKSKADLFVTDATMAAEGYPNANANCNGKKIQGKTLMSKSRTLKCTPGWYVVELVEPTAFTYKIDARKDKVIDVKSGKKYSARLGTKLDY